MSVDTPEMPRDPQVAETSAMMCHIHSVQAIQVIQSISLKSSVVQNLYESSRSRLRNSGLPNIVFVFSMAISKG
jgi:hypothetical protein